MSAKNVKALEICDQLQNMIYEFAVDWSQPLLWVLPQVQELEGDMKPLRDGMQSLTSQKDALLAEKTALKNEVIKVIKVIKV